MILCVENNSIPSEFYRRLLKQLRKFGNWHHNDTVLTLSKASNRITGRQEFLIRHLVGGGINLGQVAELPFESSICHNEIRRVSIMSVWTLHIQLNCCFLDWNFVCDWVNEDHVNTRGYCMPIRFLWYHLCALGEPNAVSDMVCSNGLYLWFIQLDKGHYVKLT